MARISSKLTYNLLTGGLNNVDSVETINQSTKRTESPDIVNVEYFQLGGIKTMEGNTQVGDKQDYPIVGGWEYVKGGNKYMIIALNNGDIKELNTTIEPNVFETIYTFEHHSDRVSFCNMNNGVVITNGIDDLVFYEKNRRQMLKGSVTITQGSIDVTGVGTEFTVELKQGDKIEIDGNTYFIYSVDSDTSLRLRTEALTSTTDSLYYMSDISECNAILVNEDDPDLSTPIRGRAINFYNGRLWVGGDNGLFYSQVGQYNKWDIKYDAGVLYSIYNDTSKITALGLYSEYLMVHKEFSTYILTCTGDSTTISIKPYSNVTCNSQQSFIVSNTKYFVYSVDHMDIYPLMQHTVFSDKFLGEPITQKVRNLFLNLRTSDLDKIFFVSHPKKRWMISYLPMVDQLGSGYGLIYDFQTKSFLVRKVPQDVTIAFNFNSNIYIGTRDGLVLKEFDSLYFNGETINAYYKSPWFDWADGYTHSFSEFAIEIANEYNNDFYIRTFKDGSSPFEDRIINSELLTGDSLTWDGIEGQDLPDNDTYWAYPEIDLENEDIGDSWVEGTFNHIRMLLPNNVFDKFQLEIGTNQLGQAFAIYGYGFRRIETDEAPW